MFPTCRTLAYKRRRLGLSQTRLAAICIVASLNAGDTLKRQIADWILNFRKSEVSLLDATNISDLESNRLFIKTNLRARLNKIISYLISDPSTDLTDYPKDKIGPYLKGLRLSFGMSQTRFAVVCWLAESDLTEEQKAGFIKQIADNKFSCPLAGDATHIGQLETGQKQLSDLGIEAFCRGFELALGQPVRAMDLFDDYLDEIETYTHFEF